MPSEQKRKPRGQELNLRVHPESGTKIQADKWIIKKGRGRSLSWNRNKVWKKKSEDKLSEEPNSSASVENPTLVN